MQHDPSIGLRRHPGIVAADMDGETVMMSIEQGQYFGLNSVGGRVWELLREPHTLTDLVAVLCAEFDVPIETCGTDVQRFVDRLIASDLVIQA